MAGVASRKGFWRTAALVCLALSIAAILMAGWKGAIELDQFR